MKTEKEIMKQIRKRYKKLNALQLLFLILVFCLITLLGFVLCTLPEDAPPGLANAVSSLQEQSGVESPVTAVLLNFRGYDTLLEVMVLLLAVIGVWSLIKSPSTDDKTDISPVQMGVVRLLAPVMCMVALYLVWQGSHLAGGAFQGGAIFGAVGVLLLVSEIPWLQAVPAYLLRIGLILGPMTFLITAICCLFLTGSLLAYPEGTAGWLILLIETTCALSIGLTLSLLFAGGHPDEMISGGDTP